ncbi:MAG: DUF350 domain-containing protein [Myxococcales bacterium]|nr:DUF350 domain-containing protein [Polyangiaceae bacterium]MDW8249060.1 DUF350 domain-containing protein [Myxococcales bacterium]
MDLSSLQASGIEMLLAVALGLLLLVPVPLLLEKILPFSLKTAIRGKRNNAVSVILFSILLGLSMIIHASLQAEAGPVVTPAAASSAGGAPPPARSVVPRHTTPLR